MNVLVDQDHNLSVRMEHLKVGLYLHLRGVLWRNSPISQGGINPLAQGSLFGLSLLDLLVKSFKTLSVIGCKRS